jgi:hypothetical protein
LQTELGPLDRDPCGLLLCLDPKEIDPRRRACLYQRFGFFPLRLGGFEREVGDPETGFGARKLVVGLSRGEGDVVALRFDLIAGRDLILLGRPIRGKRLGERVGERVHQGRVTRELLGQRWERHAAEARDIVARGVDRAEPRIATKQLESRDQSRHRLHRPTLGLEQQGLGTIEVWRGSDDPSDRLCRGQPPGHVE